MNVVNLKQKLALFQDHWHPRIVGELNGQYVKIVKVQGEFVWHCHEHEDELFLILSGSLTLCMEDGDRVLNEGEMFIVPRGVRHKPVAHQECCILLFEPKSVVNTGDVGGEMTAQAEWLH